METCIPHGGYWTTPFAKWQGSLAHLHSMEFAAHVTRLALTDRGMDGSQFDYGVLGMTIPQKSCFYGLPWLTAMAGMEHVAGPTVSQACATSARVMATASREIQAGMAECALAVTADRISNGPHLYYPDPLGPGGTGQTEDWVM
ncbi:MAG: thiolase family protein, partial [Gammaproteobacteria bacterium]|nr:thiolase family protein [Gammaproteobacteria bacterium]